MPVKNWIATGSIEGSHVSAYINMYRSMRNALWYTGTRRSTSKVGKGWCRQRCLHHCLADVLIGNFIGRAHATCAIPQRICCIVWRRVCARDFSMRRHVPVPIRQTKIHVAHELSENPLVKIKVCTMPRKEVPTAMDLGAVAAVPTMNVRLALKTAWIIRIARIQSPHGLISIF